MPTAKINGVRLFYDVTGSGPPLLFIHGGFGGLSTTIAPDNQEWASFLIDRYTFIRYDRRATGRSEYPEDGFDIETLAADARALLNHVGADQAYVMGDSAGGPIAMTFAILYPAAARGLILAETGARLLSGSFADRIRARVDVLARESPEVAYQLRKEKGDVGIAGPQEWYTPPPELAVRLERSVEAAKARIRATTRAERIRWYAGELRNYAAYLDLDLAPELERIRVPTLVIHGVSDQLVPQAFGKQLAARIPGATFVPIAGAGHGVMYFPGAVDALRKWLDDNESEAS